MPIGVVRYKLGLLCQLPKPRFEAKVLLGDTLSFLVRRLFVAQNVGKTATPSNPQAFINCQKGLE